MSKLLSGQDLQRKAQIDLLKVCKSRRDEDLKAAENLKHQLNLILKLVRKSKSKKARKRRAITQSSFSTNTGKVRAKSGLKRNLKHEILHKFETPEICRKVEEDK